MAYLKGLGFTNIVWGITVMLLQDLSCWCLISQEYIIWSVVTLSMGSLATAPKPGQSEDYRAEILLWRGPSGHYWKVHVLTKTQSNSVN